MLDIADTLTEKLSALLEYVQAKGEAADGFITEQAPLVAREIVAWSFWSSVATAIAFFALAMIFVGLAARCYRFAVKEDSENVIFCAFVMFAISLMLLFLAGWYAANVVKAGVAPRIVVIEYLNQQIKK